MKSTILMYIEDLKTPAFLTEDFEGSFDETQQWAFERADEFMDLVGLKNDFISSKGPDIGIDHHPEDFFIFTAGSHNVFRVKYGNKE